MASLATNTETRHRLACRRREEQDETPFVKYRMQILALGLILFVALVSVLVFTVGRSKKTNLHGPPRPWGVALNDARESKARGDCKAAMGYFHEAITAGRRLRPIREEGRVDRLRADVHDNHRMDPQVEQEDLPGRGEDGLSPHIEIIRG